jgi:hypothetical protein
MTLRPVLFAAITLGMLVPGAPSMARADHRVTAASRTQAAPVHAVVATATVHGIRPAVARSQGMIVQTGAARRGAPVRSATGNGIAGVDLARPTARGTIGGGNVLSGGIDGGTVNRRP